MTIDGLCSSSTSNAINKRACSKADSTLVTSPAARSCLLMDTGSQQETGEVTVVLW